VPRAVCEKPKLVCDYQEAGPRLPKKSLPQRIKHASASIIECLSLAAKELQCCPAGDSMSTYQAFLLGMMVAWTPSLLLLALVLVKTPDLSQKL
jgi:hypothetical protein